MKKLVSILLLYLIVTPFLINAEQLVFVSLNKNIPVKFQLKEYDKPVFQGNHFMLVHEPDDWNIAQSNQEVLTNWDDTKYYYVLYPIREYEKSKIINYAAMLKSTPDYLIIETNHAVLNDIEIFHSFKIVRIFNQKLKYVDQSQLPISAESILFNPVIQQLVDTVSVDSLWHYIATLQSMERYTTNGSAISSSNYLKNFFLSLGYDTVYFHTWQSGSIPNVIAEKFGTLYPDEIYVVGGHYDTYTNGAPGADDNGSGSASIMEMARVMSPLTYKRTLKYILFSGEELGLLGSSAYASQAASNGDNILGMINMDMIAYVQPGDQIDVDVVKNTASQDLYDAYLLATQTYVPTLPVVIGSLPFGASSDHASFWNNGFKAIFPFEDSDNYSPYIHTSQDVLGTSANNQTLAELGTKSVVAALASFAEIADSRIAGSVYSAATTDPISNAKVAFNGDSVFTNPDGNFMTPDLAPDNYQIIISADGFESDTINHTLLLYEVFNINLNLIPVGMIRPYIHVSNIIIDDDSTGNSLGNNNGVADAGETIEIFTNLINTGNLDAFNVTAGIQSASSWVTVFQDSCFADSVLIDSTDISNNSALVQIDSETPANTEIPFTVELRYQGFSNMSSFNLTVNNRGDILIIDDDDNEGGLAAHTTALDCLNITYDVASSSILHEEMSHYDYMIWFCGDDYSGTLTSDDQLKLSNYLDNGGKLFISGVDIGYDINSDPFYTNYLKANYIADGPYSTTTQVFGTTADPIAGDFSIGLGINDNYVDQINAVGGASQIFEYNDNGTYYGCGLKYDGIYQLVYLTFSFENIQDENHRLTLFNNIWNWFGGNLAGIDNRDKTVYKYHLSQNYPNPFNPVTNIRYQLPEITDVKLVVYNMIGQKIKTLVNGQKDIGYYNVQWDGLNDNGYQVATGIYIYRFEAGEYIKSQKMILMK